MYHVLMTIGTSKVCDAVRSFIELRPPKSKLSYSSPAGRPAVGVCQNPGNRNTAMVRVNVQRVAAGILSG